MLVLYSLFRNSFVFVCFLFVACCCFELAAKVLKIHSVVARARSFVCVSAACACGYFNCSSGIASVLRTVRSSENFVPSIIIISNSTSINFRKNISIYKWKYVTYWSSKLFSARNAIAFHLLFVFVAVFVVADVRLTIALIIFHM